MRDSLAYLEIMDLSIQVVLGTLLAALVPVVGFNAVMTSEHFASFLVSIVVLVLWLMMSSNYFWQNFLLVLKSDFILPLAQSYNCRVQLHVALSSSVMTDGH